MRGEQLKTCTKCDVEKPTRDFPAHPLRLYSKQCRKCFPLAKVQTRKAAFKAATHAKYPGVRYARLMELRHGREHWEGIQAPVVQTIKALGGGA